MNKNTQSNTPTVVSLNDFNENMWSSILLISAKNGDLSRVQVCLNNGANIEATNDTGRTALLIAARYGKTMSLDLLIQNKADIYVTDKYDTNALTLATVFDSFDCADLLIKTGLHDISSFDDLDPIYFNDPIYAENVETIREQLVEVIKERLQETRNKVDKHQKPQREALEKKSREEKRHTKNRTHLENLNKRKAPILKRRPQL